MLVLQGRDSGRGCQAAVGEGPALWEDTGPARPGPLGKDSPQVHVETDPRPRFCLFQLWLKPPESWAHPLSFLLSL